MTVVVIGPAAVEEACEAVVEPGAVGGGEIVAVDTVVVAITVSVIVVVETTIVEGVSEAFRLG